VIGYVLLLIGLTAVMWGLSAQSWRQLRRVRLGLEPKPHERIYWSLVFNRFLGPIWTAYLLVLLARGLS